MTATALVAVFAAGLLGGVHCMGMCGGIVAALSAQPVPVSGNTPAAPVLPRVVRRWPHAHPLQWRLQLAFNAGRISAYALAGALAGMAGSMALFLNHLLPVQVVMYGFANLMLLGLGLYLLGVTHHLAPLERLGARLWRHVNPVARHLLPANTVARALAFGALWGWVPCGLVYSILATALVSGSAANGAALMVAFGLGTLPNLLFAGVLMRWLAQGAGAVQRRKLWWRRVAGTVMLALGVLGLAHVSGAHQSALGGALGGASGAWLCFTPQ